MHTLESLTDQILSSISDYVEFDAKEIFEQGDFIAIFGGAVRDSIAKKEIHDIDILCLPESAHHLREFVISKGYELADLYDKDQWEQYEHISIIAEPWCFQKGKKIIQIIRPRFVPKNKGGPRFTCGNMTLPWVPVELEAVKAYYLALGGVDITCCGVFIEKNNHQEKLCANDSKDSIILKESHDNAILHCLAHVFNTQKNSGMYSEKRTLNREFKLIDRGWKSMTNRYSYIKNIVFERILKLANIEFIPEYDYKVFKYFYTLNPQQSNFDDLNLTDFFDVD